MQNENMYLLQGKLNAKGGHHEELENLLLKASSVVSKTKGCRLYVIGRDKAEPNAVHITEIWDSKADHDHSLQADGIREIIAKAMPIIDGQPAKGMELTLSGGHLVLSPTE